jgi:putative lipoprotein
MIVIASIISGGCHDMATSEPAASALADTRWTAEDIDGRGVIDEARSTIEFQGSEKIAGETGCNRYFASITVVGDSISVGAIAATRRACPPALMNQEQHFTRALADVRRYTLDGPHLLLFDAAGNQRLRLVRSSGSG